MKNKLLKTIEKLEKNKIKELKNEVKFIVNNFPEKKEIVNAGLYCRIEAVKDICLKISQEIEKALHE